MTDNVHELGAPGIYSIKESLHEAIERVEPNDTVLLIHIPFEGDFGYDLTVYDYTKLIGVLEIIKRNLLEDIE